VELKRVVALTPIGNNVEAYWQTLLAGKSGAARITRFDPEKFKTQFACELKDFDITEHMHRREARRMDRFSQYAMVTAEEAVIDAGIKDHNFSPDRIGVIWGSGIGGLDTFLEECMNFAKGDGSPRFNPFFIPKMITDLAPGHISIKYGFRGPNYTTVSACASSTNSLIDAFNYIRLSKVDICLAGGSESAVNQAGIGGFNAMHALSTRNDSPETASRPFDKERDGFVLGEGAGCIVLEEYEHAKARGAKIYAELVGSGISSDAHHITAPHPEGLGAKSVMEQVLEESGLSPADIDYINVHGTSTPLGDVAELKAIKDVFKEDAYKLNISSTKSMTGHLLGAAGAVEAIAAILAIQNNVVPPTINHGTIDPDIDERFNLTLHKPQEREVRAAISNTFGFGGHNASVLFRKLS
jgi:3-oxoacyl-[acyl-carrier-protein] synthase II